MPVGVAIGDRFISGDQKVAVTVPRVRDLRRGQEVPLASYAFEPMCGTAH